MNALLAATGFVVSGRDVGAILWWFVGAIICFAIVYAILKALDSPPVAFKALYVIAGIAALALALRFFFGGP